LITAISNAKWIAVSQVSLIASQIANIIVLARFLQPSDYGLMGMALIITNLALLLRDMGTASAIIQMKEINDDIITSIFWLNMVVGLIMLVLIVASSTMVATFFKQPNLVPVLCALAIIFPILSVSSAQKALLERNSSFKSVAKVEVYSSILAMTLAIFAAINGFGVYSFVVQAVTSAIFSSVSIWFISSWRPSFKPSFSKIKEVLPFSSHMTGFQVIIYCTRNLDSVVIGRVLGSHALGLYSVASKIMLLPIQNISWVASRALYPIMSRQQDDLEAMGITFLQTIRTISFISAPLMMGIFVLREPFIQHCLGAKWIGVSQILTYLAPVGYLQSIVGINTTVLMAQGRTRLLMWFSGFTGIVLTIAFLVGARFGIQGVALGYLIATLIGSIPILYLATKLISIKLSLWLKVLSGSIFCSMAMALVIHFIYIEDRQYFNQSVIAFLCLLFIGVISYIGLTYFFIPKQVKSIISVLIRRKSKAFIFDGQNVI
jgi:PST family polysaccharide transporter